MRHAFLLALIVVLGATPALAQTNPQPTATHRATKLMIGAGALALGALVAAKSSETTTVTTGVGTLQTSTFSTSQLMTGLAIAATGGFLL